LKTASKAVSGLSLLVLASCSKREVPRSIDHAMQPSATLAATCPSAMGDQPGLHNVFEVSDNLFSGSEPEGDAGFDSAKALGVRTIISVDGATPDLERARARGMRYVHLPVGYNGIPVDKQRQIARAVRDLPKPVYLHCHHGKHRGPTAAASAVVLLGLLSPQEALAFMKRAGTGEMYTGLYECVRSAVPAENQALDATPADFPEVARVEGLTEAMVEIDERFEHLELIRAAGWKVRADHPDLEARVEAHRLAELLAGQDSEAEKQRDPALFRQLLSQATTHARVLDSLLSADALPLEQANAQIEALKASCRDCHTQLRDRSARPTPTALMEVR